MRTINFIPEDYRPPRSPRHASMLRGVVTLTAIVIAAIWYVVATGQVSKLNLTLDALRQESKELGQPESPASKLESRRRALTKLIAEYDSVQSPLDLSLVLGVLDRSMPPSMGLTNLSIVRDISAPPGSGAASPRKSASRKRRSTAPRKSNLTLDIEGLAPTDVAIAKLVGKLAQHPLFASVKLKYSRPTVTDDLFAREFHIQIEIPLNRNVEIISVAEVANAQPS